MNERIKQCWLTAARQDSGDKWDSQEEFIERFAKLIVRECISICKDKERPNLYSVREVEEAIKQHFGVEE